MSRGGLVGPVRPRAIEGTGAEVTKELELLRARGALVSPMPPPLVPSQRVVVHVHVIQHPARRGVRTRWVVASVAGGTVALAGTGYLVYLATAALVDHALPMLGGLVLLMLLLGWVGAGQAGACPGSIASDANAAAEPRVRRDLPATVRPLSRRTRPGRL